MGKKIKNNRSGPLVKINKSRCKGCGLCIFYCPCGHLEFSSNLNIKGVKFAKIKENTLCSGCAFCELICPDNCVKLSRGQEKNSLKF